MEGMNSAASVKAILLSFLLLCFATACAPTLHDYARTGDINHIQSTIEKGVDVDQKNKINGTPLLYAAANGKIEVVKLLIENGADVNAKENSIGSTPLNEAANNGHAEVVKFLLQNGAVVDVRNNNLVTPLWAASREGHIDTVKILIDHGGDVNAKSTTLQTPLFAAVINGHDEIVETLIDHGADVNIKESSVGSTPLLEAIQRGYCVIAEELIHHGADVNAVNQRGFSPLQSAASNGHRKLTELLIAKRAEIDHLDDYLQSPLFYAAWKGRTDVVVTLLSNGANTDFKNFNGYDAKGIATLNNNLQIANLIENASQSKLLFAVMMNDIEKTKLLIQEGEDVNRKNSEGLTPLLIASNGDNKDIARLLLDAGAQVDPVEEDPELTARAFTIASDYYFEKKDISRGIEHFEVANEYSEKASVKDAENSVQFKAANVTIGAVAGAVVGGLVGALGGKSEYVEAGAAAGALIGAGIGYGAEKKRLYFATEEARIEAMLKHIGTENQRLGRYISVTHKYVEEIKTKIEQINQEYASGEKSLKETQDELSKIQANREKLSNSIAAFKKQKEKYQELAEIQRAKSGEKAVVALDNRLKELEGEIAKLEGSLASLDEVLKISKVG